MGQCKAEHSIGQEVFRCVLDTEDDHDHTDDLGMKWGSRYVAPLAEGACNHSWADRRPGVRRGMGHADGSEQHRCMLVEGHTAVLHRCPCGAIYR